MNSTPLAAQAYASLTLEAALDLALKANPDLLSAQQEVRAIEGSVLQAGVRPNPDVAASIEDFRKATRTTTVQLNQALELGGNLLDDAGGGVAAFAVFAAAVAGFVRVIAAVRVAVLAGCVAGLGAARRA